MGISPAHLSAAGFAENKPVASNETQEGKAQNRRIEIVLLPLDVDRVLEELERVVDMTEKGAGALARPSFS